MKELLEFIVTSLADDKEAVSVSVTDNGDTLDCLILVSAADIGKIIGMNGKIAVSIRTLARAAARKNNQKVNIKIDKIEKEEE